MDILYDKIQSFGRRGTLQRIIASGSIVAASSRTDVSITGKGYLLYVATWSSGGLGPEQIRITVDGATPSLIGLVNGVYVPTHTSTTAGNGKFFALDIPFSTSLKVEIYNATGASIGPQSELAYIISP